MDYPRVCGGTFLFHVAQRREKGLSPRVRGNRFTEVEGNLRARTIPACAGEPSYRHQWRPAPGDYPRVCGGTSSGAVAIHCAPFASSIIHVL